MAADSGKEPQDAVIIRQLLDSMGVEEYEPRVVHQLLDFMYGYVAGTLQDAEAYGERAGLPKGTVEVDDVLTAIQSRATFSFVQPPSQDILTALAEKRNKQPLPEIGKAHGLRLPPEDACLTAPIWGLPRPATEQQEAAGTSAAAGDSRPADGSGPSAMDEDSGSGSIGTYPWKQQQAGGGGGKRPALAADPGEAPDD